MLTAFFMSSAVAGTLHVESPGGAVTVVVDGKAVGQVPLDLDLTGQHTLGFRTSAFGATVFEQRVDVPAAGGLIVAVDLAARSAVVTAAPAPPAPAATPAAAPQPVGDVFIQADVVGARIYVDGVDTGIVTPGMVRGLAPGEHSLVIRTECARVVAKFPLVADRIARLETFTLAPGDGKLKVEVEAKGATVLVDGAPVGAAPYEGLVGCGEHLLEARAPGHLSQTTTLRTPAYETTLWSPVLPAETYGTLVVDVTPVTAVIAVDGIELPPGPGTIDPISTGPHELRVAADGYEPQVQSVMIEPEALARVVIELVPPLPPRASPVPRLAANGAATAAGVGLGAYALVQYIGARAAYGDFLDEPSDAKADALYDAEVAPRLGRAVASGIGAGLALAGAGVLWATTDFGSGSSATTIGLSRTW